MTRGAVEKIAAALSTQGLQGEDHFCRAACIVVYRADVRCGTLHILAIARGGSEAGEEREKEVEGHPYRKTHIPSTDLNPTIQIQICMFMNLWLVIFPFLLSCIARFGSFIPSFFFPLYFQLFAGEFLDVWRGSLNYEYRLNPPHFAGESPTSGRKKIPQQKQKRPIGWDLELRSPTSSSAPAAHPRHFPAVPSAGVAPPHWLGSIPRRRKIRLAPGHQNCHSKPPKMKDLSHINGETSSNMSIWKDKQLQNIADLI